MTEHLHFTTKNQKVWVRNVYGFEGVAACMSNDAGGMNHFYIGSAVRFAEPVSAETLKEPVARAWIRLRHWAPVVGTRSKAEEGVKNTFLITYEPPASVADAVKWASETVKWDDSVTSLVQRDDKIKEVWWKPSDDHWGMEMHVGPSEDGLWSFILAAGHWSSDARGTIPLVSKFFEYLLEELKGSSSPVESLSWGSETSKLAPAATQALKMSEATPAAAANAPPTPTESNVTLGKPAADAPAPPVMFGRPPALCVGQGATSADDNKSLTGRIVLTREETALLMKESKAHGATITETVNTILILAEIETIIRTAAKDAEKFAQVKALFESAAIYPLALTTFDRRAFLAPEYATHDSPRGCPSFAFEGFPTVHSMEHIRKCIAISGTNVDITATKEAFWGGAVADTVGQLEALKKQGSPEGYVGSQTATEGMAKMFEVSMFALPAMVTTSTGSLTKLGLLARWEPRARGPLTITQLILSLRATFPYNTTTFWEWDDQISINMHVASEHQTTKGLQMSADAVKRWVAFIGKY